MTEDAPGYEETLVRTVPFHEAFYGTILSYLPGDDAKILELGCGTGFLTSQITSFNPDVAITCIDSDPAMLTIAKAKSALKDASFIQGDITEVWPDATFDAIVTSFLLFLLPSKKRDEVLEKAYHSLSDGGRIVVGDIVAAEERWAQALSLAHWRRFMVASGLPGEEADEYIRMNEAALSTADTPRDLADRMREAGFSRVTIPYTCELQAVVVGFV